MSKREFQHQEAMEKVNDMSKFRDMKEQDTFHAGRDYERKISDKRIEELEVALGSIWPFIKNDFPKGTGENHGTCATDGYVLAARQVEQVVKG